MKLMTIFQILFYVRETQKWCMIAISHNQWSIYMQFIVICDVLTFVLLKRVV